MNDYGDLAIQRNIRASNDNRNWVRFYAEMITSGFAGHRMGLSAPRSPRCFELLVARPDQGGNDYWLEALCKNTADIASKGILVGVDAHASSATFSVPVQIPVIVDPPSVKM